MEEGETQGQRYIDMWRELLEGFDNMTGFVVFSHGSVVILKRPHVTVESARDEAMDVMKKYGPVFAGSTAGDFSVDDTKGMDHIPKMKTNSFQMYHHYST